MKDDISTKRNSQIVAKKAPLGAQPDPFDLSQGLDSNEKSSENPITVLHRPRFNISDLSLNLKKVSKKDYSYAIIKANVPYDASK